MDIVIVGGGTAGWMTALYAQKNFPQHNILLIESKNIGILGAGEGAATNFVDFANHIGIDLKDMIVEAKATLKSGIKFTNWSKNKEYFYHGFGGNFQNLASFNQIDVDKVNFFGSEFLIPNIQNDQEEIYVEMSEQKRVMFVYDPNIETQNPLNNFRQYYRYSFHFDARAMASFLSRLGTSRGIKVIEGEVVSFNSLENGDIQGIVLKDNTIVKSDFIFDCSGFSRLIIGKHFNSNWISFKDKLPMKKAIPFFLKMDEDGIPPYTEAIAMNYGWVWKIPLQHRYGCGYVFDSDYISENQAMEEIEKFFNIKPEYPRGGKGAFSFDPGCFDRVLINNVLAVGLSSGFVEPLEATSIAQLIVLLRRFFTNPRLLIDRDKDYVEHFNKKYVNDSEFVADFIHMHYLTNKSNSLFWNEFKQKNQTPKSLTDRIKLMNNETTFDDDLFSMHSAYSYYAIANGMDIVDKDRLAKAYSDLGFDSHANLISLSKTKNADIINLFLSHKDFLKKLGAFNE